MSFAPNINDPRTSINPDGTVFPVLCEYDGCSLARTAQQALVLGRKHAAEHGLGPSDMDMSPNFVMMLANERQMHRSLDKLQRLKR